MNDLDDKGVREALARYSIGPVRDISPILSGHINATYRIATAQGTYILQLLGAVFNERTVYDMERVTAHLSKKGVLAPRVLHTAEGASFLKSPGGRVWRLTTFIEGDIYENLTQDSYAAEAGKVLATFHVAMSDFDAKFLKSKPFLHNIQEIYESFCAAYENLLREEPDKVQREYYRYIQEKMASLMLPADLPTTIIHADPKISNVVFSGGKGICMIDLDTCMRHTPLVDLGDALRWCAISEEAFPNAMSLPQFKYSIEGYRNVEPLSPEMKEYLMQAFAMVTLGLASRFAKDVYHDNYFGWNPKKYPSRKEHNKARARSLVSLTQDILRKEKEMRDILKSCH
ncbi:MAG: phosphotransferase [Candidatus Liptonbacteria bacterium]|nr:phosphotransferase [Candidatus Liptonbacteria bacterium]